MLNVQFLSMGFVHLSVLSTVNVPKFRTFLSLFSNKMFVFRAGICSQNACQKQSDQGLCCLSMPFYRQLVFEILEHLPYFVFYFF